MATVIRFARHGTKKKPYFRIVVQDHHAARDGRFIENIGSFDPVKGPETLLLERVRLEYWLGVGAKMSNSVKSVVKNKWIEWKTLPVATPASSKKEV